MTKSVFELAADFLEESIAPASTWYCDKPNCDGKPHAGWEWNHARPEQRPPQSFLDGVARVWLIMAGRGFGKTRSGAEWIAHEARQHAKTEWAIVAPTYKDLKEVCIEGVSGLQAVLLDVPGVQYNRTSLEIKLPNGSIIRSYSAETPERTRGPNLSGAWLDEIAQAQNTYPEAYKTLSMAIRRKGSQAQVMATTTPEGRSKLVREFTDRKDGSVVITRGSTYDNRDNLSEAYITDLEIRHKGTRFERQEIFGELLEDVPGALWSPATIERSRMVMPSDAPQL